MNSAELVAEEIAARVDPSYDWSPDFLRATRVFPSGTKFEIEGDEIEGEILIRLSWMNNGDRDWRDVSKWMKGAVEKSLATLKRSLWTADQVSDAQSFVISGSIATALAVKQMSTVVGGCKKAVDIMRF